MAKNFKDVNNFCIDDVLDVIKNKKKAKKVKKDK